MKKDKIAFCRYCGKRLDKSNIDGYTYQCWDCDEDFYCIEQREYPNYEIGDKVYWKDPENMTNGVYEIVGFQSDSNTIEYADTIIHLHSDTSYVETVLSEIYPIYNQ